MHDCWTYWGHSGAPIVGRRSQGGSRRGGGERAKRRGRRKAKFERGEGEGEGRGEGGGMLMGLHSSWDDTTGMRRGVAWEAIRAFLHEHTAVLVDG